MANDFTSDSNVVAHWKFDNDSLDSEGGNDLGNSGAPTYDSSDKMEGTHCLRVDGNDVKTIADASLDTGFPLKNGDTTKVFSVCFWHKAVSDIQYGKAYSKWKSAKWSFAIQPGNDTYTAGVDWGTGTGSTSEWHNTSYNPTTGQWYHYGVTVDGVNKTLHVRIYGDTEGSLVYDGSFTPAAVLNVEDAALRIGGEDNTGDYWLNSKIDEVVVFNRILNNAEIDAIRAGTYSGTGLTTTTTSSTTSSTTSTTTSTTTTTEVPYYIYDNSSASYSSMDTGWSGYNMSWFIPATEFSGNANRIRVHAVNEHGSTSFTCTHFCFGERSTVDHHVLKSGTAVEMQFSGTDGVTLAAGEDAWSDEFDYDFDDTKSYGFLIWGIANIPYCTDTCDSFWGAPTGGTCYDGLTQHNYTTRLYVVDKIERIGDAPTTTTSSTTSTTTSTTTTSTFSTTTTTVYPYDDLLGHDWSASTNGDMTISVEDYFSSFFGWRTNDNTISPPWGYWLMNGTAGWWKVDLGVGVTAYLDRVDIQVNDVPEPNRAPKDFTIQGSNNDSDWDTLATFSDETSWGDSEIRQFSVQDGNYRYFKIDITANNGDASYVQLAELYLWGTAYGLTTTTSSTTSSSTTSSSTSSTASSTASSTSTSSTASSTSTTNPPEYWEDFSGHTLWAESISGWTERWHTTAIQGFIGPSPRRPDSSRQSAIINGVTTTEDRAALSWDEVGTVTDAEILCRVWITNGSQDAAARIYLRGSGTTGETAYFVSLDCSAGIFLLAEYNSGAYTSHDTDSYTFLPGVWYWVRFQAIGTNLKGKFWVDGDVEPAAWNVEASDSSLASGWVGIGGYYNAESAYFDWIGVDTGVETVAEPEIEDASLIDEQTDFSEYDAPDYLIDWTRHYEWGYRPTYVDGDFGGVIGSAEGATSSRFIVSWDRFAGTDDVEILARLRNDTDNSDSIRLYLRGSGYGGSESCYMFHAKFSTNSIQLGEYTGGSWSLHDSDSYTCGVDTWYWMRFRAEGTLLKAKIWSGSLFHEPVDWTLEGTDSTHTSGFLGFGTYYGETDCDFFSVAVDGGTAAGPTGLTSTTTTSSTTTSSTTASTTSTTYSFTTTTAPGGVGMGTLVIVTTS